MAIPLFPSRRRLAAGLITSTLFLGASAVPALASQDYEVKPGDTLTQISRSTGVSTTDLVAANGLSSPDQIRSGQILVIPGTFYTVEPGDTLSEIARDFGVSRAELAKVNDIANPNRIRVGSVLSIPGVVSAPVTAPTSAPADESTGESAALTSSGTYTVQAGESLSEIARDLGVERDDLIELNELANPDRIQEGQSLLIPGPPPAPAAEPAPEPAPQPAPEPTVSRAEALAAYPSMPSYVLNDPTRLAMIPLFERYASENGLPVDLVMAVAWQESGWRADAISSAGAYGVGQIMPATGEWIASDLIGDTSLTRENPDDNIRMSARYLRWLEAYMGSTDLALAGYFQGPNAVKAELADPEAEPNETTLGYVASVQAHRRFFVPAGS